MNDAAVVRGLERVGDLPRGGQRLVERQAAARDPIGQRRSFDQFQDERFDVAAVFEAVSRAP